uniref:Uncharacterized protein n=1 Tax=Sphaerodactylus townsendi TaxID=933632 RepID=A0ACB8EZV4_9SAUR
MSLRGGEGTKPLAFSSHPPPHPLNCLNATESVFPECLAFVPNKRPAWRRGHPGLYLQLRVGPGSVPVSEPMGLHLCFPPVSALPNLSLPRTVASPTPSHW